MITCMILFIIGCLIGGIAVGINDWLVDVRTARLEKENRRLQEKIHRDRVEYERDRAYRAGYHAAMTRQKKG